jgi:hypothetical protein
MGCMVYSDGVRGYIQEATTVMQQPVVSPLLLGTMVGLPWLSKKTFRLLAESTR